MSQKLNLHNLLRLNKKLGSVCFASPADDPRKERKRNSRRVSVNKSSISVPYTHSRK